MQVSVLILLQTEKIGKNKNIDPVLDIEISKTLLTQ